MNLSIHNDCKYKRPNTSVQIPLNQKTNKGFICFSSAQHCRRGDRLRRSMRELVVCDRFNAWICIIKSIFDSLKKHKNDKLNTAFLLFSTADVVIGSDGQCEGEWVCEHRWKPIAGMAGFSKATNGMTFDNWVNEVSIT